MIRIVKLLFFLWYVGIYLWDVRLVYNGILYGGYKKLIAMSG